jgi:hypothetical protein
VLEAWKNHKTTRVCYNNTILCVQCIYLAHISGDTVPLKWKLGEIIRRVPKKGYNRPFYNYLFMKNDLPFISPTRLQLSVDQSLMVPPLHPVITMFWPTHTVDCYQNIIFITYNLPFYRGRYCYIYNKKTITLLTDKLRDNLTYFCLNL